MISTTSPVRGSILFTGEAGPRDPNRSLSRARRYSASVRVRSFTVARRLGFFAKAIDNWNAAGPHAVLLLTANAYVSSEVLPPKTIECEEEAKRTPSSLEAEAWLKLAKQWRDMADRIERY
jgi:hypothetical protein